MFTFLPGPSRRSLLLQLAGLFACLGFQAAVAEEDSHAMQRTEKSVEQMLQSVRAQYELPGVIAAEIDGGRLTSLAAIGQRKQGATERISPGDLVHLGSCTKAMTATLLALLVQENHIEWESTVGAVLPDLRDDMHPSYRQVTLRQLLTHSGGLPAHDERIFRADSRLSPTQQRRALFNELLASEPDYPPGSRHVYSNLGYMLAGLMAETVTGQSWEQLMRMRLFRPLRMETAGFGPPGTPGRVDQPWGHQETSDGNLAPRQRDNPPILGPAGRVHCSVADWSRFLAVHLNHQPDPPLLTEVTLRELHRPVQDAEYALGWLATPRTWARGRALTHAGSNTMWFAVVWLAPNRDFGVLAVTNSGQSNAAQACDDVVAWLIRQRNGDPTTNALPADDHRVDRLGFEAPFRLTEFPFRAAPRHP